MDRSIRCLLAFWLALAWAWPARAQDAVRVFAAASLTDALTDAAARWQAEANPAPILVFGGSATLAKQIDAGAPADVFASADTSWMDFLASADRIDADSRVALLGNTLVLVAPAGKPMSVRLEAEFDLPGAFAGKLCMAEPDVVPAGIYARQALAHYGWWEALAPRVVGADDVRTALSFVERGECALGIVYATDARDNPRVVEVAGFPPASHAPIVYPFAVVRGRPDGAAARRFLNWLRTAPAARAAFEQRGFAWRAH